MNSASLYKNLIFLLLVLAPCLTRSQAFPFYKAIDSLSYGVAITPQRLDSAIAELKASISGHYDSGGIESLAERATTYLDSGTAAQSYSILSTQSPFPTVPVDSAYVILSVGVIRHVRRLADLDLRFEFSSRKRLTAFLKAIDQLFTSAKAWKKTGGDTGPEGRVIQYGAFHAANVPGMGVFLFYQKSEKPGWYTLRCLPTTIFGGR